MEPDDAPPVDFLLAERFAFDVRIVPGIEQEQTITGQGIPAFGSVGFGLVGESQDRGRFVRG